MIYWQHLTPKNTCLLLSPYLLLVHNNRFFILSEVTIRVICKTAIFFTGKLYTWWFIIVFFVVFLFFFFYTPAPRSSGGYTVLPLSVQDIFRHIFLSNCWWQKSDIWSQAFLDPSDSYFLFADLVGFYTHWTYYAHFSSHFSQQLLMTEIWYLVTSFI
jgi:hypothetical protein